MEKNELDKLEETVTPYICKVLVLLAKISLVLAIIVGIALSAYSYIYFHLENPEISIASSADILEQIGFALGSTFIGASIALIIWIISEALRYMYSINHNICSLVCIQKNQLLFSLKNTVQEQDKQQKNLSKEEEDRLKWGPPM